MWALPWRVVVDFVVVVGVLDGVVMVAADVVVDDDGCAVVETLLHETVDNGEAIDVSSISPKAMKCFNGHWIN